MRLRHASLGLIAPLLGCGDERATPGRAGQAIVGGEAATGHRAVVRVEAYGGRLQCSGTLVGDRVVVTAKHCVQAPGALRPEAPWALRVWVRGVDDGGIDDERPFEVVQVRTIPGGYESAGTALAELEGADVAVLSLGRSTDVAPLGPGPTPRPEDVMVAVGYGANERGLDGVLRVATTRVRAVRGAVLAADPVTCAGDSGGPLLDAQGRLAGVLSGAVGRCGEGESRYTLIHAAAAIVEAARCETGEGCATDAGGARSPGASVAAAPGAACSVGAPASRGRRSMPRWTSWAACLGVVATRRRGARVRRPLTRETNGRWGLRTSGAAARDATAGGSR